MDAKRVGTGTCARTVTLVPGGPCGEPAQEVILDEGDVLSWTWFDEAPRPTETDAKPVGTGVCTEALDRLPLGAVRPGRMYAWPTPRSPR